MTRDQALVNSLQFQRNVLADDLANKTADLLVAEEQLALATARIAQLEVASERLAALEEKIAAMESAAPLDAPQT